MSAPTALRCDKPCFIPCLCMDVTSLLWCCACAAFLRCLHACRDSHACLECSFHASKVLQQLRHDTEFLSHSRVKDYRLLIWVHSSEHPLEANEKLQAQLRRRCWDQSCNDWCQFHGGFLSLVGKHVLCCLFIRLLRAHLCVTVHRYVSQPRHNLLSCRTTTELPRVFPHSLGHLVSV